MQSKNTYRVWDTKYKRMWYEAEKGFWAVDPNDEETKLGDWDEEIDTFADLLNNPRYIVMQYTGQKDKNGKLIYEDDVVHVPNDWDEFRWAAGMFYQIYFNAGGFRLKPSIKIHKQDLGYWLDNSSEEMENVGNIYENEKIAEIIKKGEEKWQEISGK